MRQVRSLALYLLAVFGGGALVAPWLYWAAQRSASHSPALAHLAANPFHRFVVRSLLVVAFLGLWPLLRSCGMWRWRDLGLTPLRRAGRGLARGFLLGLSSLALVTALSVGLGGREFIRSHTGAELTRHILHAALAAVIVAFLEEILFRGALFGLLRKAVFWPPALVLSSAVYALVHFMQNGDVSGPITWSSGFAVLARMFQNGPSLIPAFFALFLAGASLALAYQRTGMLYFSMGLHAGWIFWLKSYGFFTTAAPGANAGWWGSSRLIDGWLALPVLAAVLWLVQRMQTHRNSA